MRSGPIGPIVAYLRKTRIQVERRKGEEIEKNKRVGMGPMGPDSPLDPRPRALGFASRVFAPDRKVFAHDPLPEGL